MNWKALERILDELPKCEKGLCRTPATRRASYRRDGKIVASWVSCDEHGIEPVTEFEYANELRQVVADMRAAGFVCWWDDEATPSLRAPNESEGE